MPRSAPSRTPSCGKAGRWLTGYACSTWPETITNFDRFGRGEASAPRVGAYNAPSPRSAPMNIRLAALFVMAFAITPVSATVEDDVRTTFERFVAAQNAHDISAVRDLLSDSPGFLWISRGTPIWGRDAARKRFEMLYQGTWKLAPDASVMKVMVPSDTTAQLFFPIMF